MADDLNGMNLEQNKTVINPIENSNATIVGTPVKCPICGAENAPSEKYCGDCGFLLSSTPGEESESVSVDLPILKDPTTEAEYFIKPGKNMVGREGSDILLNHPTVSRKHAIITYTDGKCIIEDVGSTNGTIVQGEKVTQPMELHDGDEIRIGSVVLTLQMPLSSKNASNQEFADDKEPEELESDDVGQQLSPVGKLVSQKKPGVEYLIYSGTNTIGRRPGNDIQIGDDPYLSGYHAEITAGDGWFEIVDVGSTNGTIVNGITLDPDVPVQLNDGDHIVLGRTQLIFHVIAENDESDAQTGED